MVRGIGNKRRSRRERERGMEAGKKGVGEMRKGPGAIQGVPQV